ncbi:uncharacterized protein LOC131233750 [Magnolia sinica]|uniref:uncharacterized protein LOC131233750 n=1 Tax=Magnolia sinica TaxID=86752 RepID=UPI00265A1DE0|nr:uncharacterized protein LOC131233750 [Magnolia sinica]
MRLIFSFFLFCFQRMASSNGFGYMAVVAVSGSVAFVAIQAHKRLVTEFMKKVEFEFGMERDVPKKKVRFADDVIEPSSNNKEYRMRHSKNLVNMNKVSMAEIGSSNGGSFRERVGNMPLNRLALYKGMVENRVMNGRIVSYSR